MLVLWGDLGKRQLRGLLINAFPAEFLGECSAGKAALGVPSAHQHGRVFGVIASKFRATLSSSSRIQPSSDQQFIAAVLV